MSSTLSLPITIPSDSSSENSISKPPSEIPAKIPPAISSLKTCQTLQELTQLHAQLVVTGLLGRRRNAGKLLESYVSSSNTESAQLVFKQITSPDTFAYNTMMRGLTLGNSAYDSILLYRQMLLGGLVPDNYTYTFVLKACSRVSALSEGKQVHCRIIKIGISPDTHVHSSLIHMYANCDGLDCARGIYAEFSDENTLIKNSMISGFLQCGNVDDAREVFAGMIVKDVATWSAMVSGYMKNGLLKDALDTFHDMVSCGVRPNESAVVTALSACAQLGALDQGRWIHEYVNRRINGKVSVVLGTSLVDMYAKCGDIDRSHEVFVRMPTKDVVTWGAMISGYAMNGRAAKCFELFDEMVGSGINPNGAIFVSVLSACSHVGLVEVGQFYFDEMVHRYGIKPLITHYGCMVDLLGRSGQLVKAMELIASMPEEPNSVIWGAFLGACRIHKELRMGEHAFRHLIELEPWSGDRFKLAGHMFTAAGKQEDAIKVRKWIKEKELETTSGSSSIEVDGTVHEFVVGDISHSDAREIYKMLEEIQRRLREVGCTAEREEVREEEERDETLSRHSERLAIAYGLLSTKAKSRLRVFKNLRICRDCHSSIKFISREFQREIIVRDRNRFHVFKEGECSCMDYW